LVCAQGNPKVALLALSKQDHTFAIADPTNLKVVARISVGDDPHDVVASKNGKTAKVSNNGHGAFHTLAEIDLLGQRPLPAIDLGALRGPHGPAFVQGKVWFTAGPARAFGSYDPSTGNADWVMGIGQNKTHMIDVLPGARHIVTTNVDYATVTVIERAGSPHEGHPPPTPQDNWQITMIPVGKVDEGFDVSPDGKEVWTANAGDGTVSIIDIALKQVVATLAVKVQGANRLKFTPDGKQVLITAGLNLVVLNAITYKPVKRLRIVRDSAASRYNPTEGESMWPAFLTTVWRSLTSGHWKSLDILEHFHK
jgi:YVTN family beta-propeller protein